MKQKLTIVLVAALSCSICLLAACSNRNDNTESQPSESVTISEGDENTSQSSKETSLDEDNQQNEEPTFEEANVMKTEMINRDDDSYEEIIATFRITNNGKEPMYYSSVDFDYLDAKGNIICSDGRYNDYCLEPGKSAIVKSFSDLDGTEKSAIDKIIVKSYRYDTKYNRYDVDVNNKKISVYENEVSQDADFEKVNIVNFDLKDKGLSSGYYNVAVKICNNGDNPIVYCSYDMAYLDKDGTVLETDGRYTDSAINPGNYANSDSYCTDEQLSQDVSSFGIFQYEYSLSKPDENGFNKYEINLQSKSVEGSLEE